jgi:hypothetical protein
LRRRKARGQEESEAESLQLAVRRLFLDLGQDLLALRVAAVL